MNIIIKTKTQLHMDTTMEASAVIVTNCTCMNPNDQQQLEYLSSTYRWREMHQVLLQRRPQLHEQMKTELLNNLASSRKLLVMFWTCISRRFRNTKEFCWHWAGGISFRSTVAGLTTQHFTSSLKGSQRWMRDFTRTGKNVHR